MVSVSKERYVDLRTDFGFQHVFGQEAHLQLPQDFLNTLVAAHHQIQTLTLETSDLSDQFNAYLAQAPLRPGVLDFYCESQNGEQLIVELMKPPKKHFKDRSVFYPTIPIQAQEHREDWMYQLPMIYVISILDFTMGDGTKKKGLIRKVDFKDKDGNPFYEKLKLIFIELPKFKKNLDELDSQQERWFYLLQHLSEISDPPEQLDGAIFQQLFEVADITRFPPTEQEQYQKDLNAYRNG